MPNTQPDMAEELFQNAYRLQMQGAFELAVQCFPHAEAWHVFYAGPAPVAVAIGQQINPTMCPRVQLYEYRHKEIPPYRASIRLGG